MHNEIIILNNECFLSRLEAAKDDYRIHCEELEKQLVELQHRNDELTSLAEESRALKDELDVLRCVDFFMMMLMIFNRCFGELFNIQNPSCVCLGVALIGQ